ncbi:MAG: 30S ribosomal protein S11 [Candidatus Diapherotrites archaeon]|nr:30S ribosomal protein S11 [Candidatus Diapherotrites archaeon]
MGSQRIKDEAPIEFKDIKKPKALEESERKKEKAKQGIIHIYASHNNTIMLLTDVTGAETIAKCSGGMVVKAQHKEGSPYAAMKVAEILVEKARERNIDEVFVKIRGQGGIRPKSPGQGAEAAIVSLTRNGIRIIGIQNVTPVPHDGCRRKKRHRSKKN